MRRPAGRVGSWAETGSHRRPTQEEERRVLGGPRCSRSGRWLPECWAAARFSSGSEADSGAVGWTSRSPDLGNAVGGGVSGRKSDATTPERATLEPAFLTCLRLRSFSRVLCLSWLTLAFVLASSSSPPWATGSVFKQLTDTTVPDMTHNHSCYLERHLQRTAVIVASLSLLYLLIVVDNTDFLSEMKGT